jgi:SUKH-4 immunity protein
MKPGHASVPPDPWRGAATLRPSAGVGDLDLPADALTVLATVGLPAAIEGMFYSDRERLLRPRSIGGVDYYELGTNEEEPAGSFMARRADGGVRHLWEDGSEPRFVNSGVGAFVAFLAGWAGFLEDFRGVDDERTVARAGRRLQRRLRRIDRQAFRDEASWWSMVFEEVEYGILGPGD